MKDNPDSIHFLLLFLSYLSYFNKFLKSNILNESEREKWLEST